MKEQRRVTGGAIGATCRSEAGYSLAELMVVTAITLVGLALSMTAIIGSRRVFDVGMLAFDANQNIRAGMTYVVRDLVQAGTGVPTGGIPIPSGPSSSAVKRPGPVASLTFTTNGILHALTPGSGAGPTVSGQQTDVVTVLYADPSVQLENWPLTSIAADGRSARADAASPFAVIQAGDLLMFSNAVGNAILCVTSRASRDIYFAAGDPYNLNQTAPAAAGTILKLKSGATYPSTVMTRMDMVTYYVDNVTSPTMPRLVRRENFQTATPVAMVIESLQASFDLVDGAAVINPALINIRVLPVANTPAQIRKVNLFLAGRSDAVDSGTRRPFRTNLATQVSLRSLAWVDRYR